MFNIKFKYLLSVGALASFSSFADTAGIVLKFDHPQVLSVSIPTNTDTTTSSGIIRTTRWAIKSNNAVEIGFSGNTPVDGNENTNPNIPLFYKQEVNARGELVAGAYDYLKTNFGVMIADHDSTQKIERSLVTNLDIMHLKADGGNATFDSQLYGALSEQEIVQVAGDAGYDRYGYVQGITGTEDLESSVQNLIDLDSWSTQNRYGKYRVATDGAYVDKNGWFRTSTTYTHGDQILTAEGYKTAVTTEIFYEECTSYEQDPLAETGTLICTNYDTKSSRSIEQINAGVTTENGTYSAIKYEIGNPTELGKIQLYSDLTLAEYGTTNWNEEMNTVGYSHEYFPKSHEAYQYNYWKRDHNSLTGESEELVDSVKGPNSLWGPIMPNDDGNFTLSLYSQGLVNGYYATQSGLYSMTVVLNVSANEQLLQ